MKSFLDRVRSLDHIGVALRLNYLGHNSYRSIGGAIATILLFSLMAFYVCSQSIAVHGYLDPQISTY